MENAIQIFNNPEFGSVRTAGTPDNPEFCLADICKSLDLRVDGVVARLTKDTITAGVLCKKPVQTNGGIQQMYFVNEDGLYDVILDSRKPEAKRFRKWITSEVLPAIRKYGVYATEDFIKQAIADPKFAIDILSALQAEREKVAVLTQQVAELQPKASYYDVVLNCKDLVSVSKIAKDYGMSAVAFNKLLHELGVQFKQGDIWLLYQQYARLGWTSTKTLSYSGDDGLMHSRIHMYWTQKGRLGLYDFLKCRGYLPKIEADKNFDDVFSDNEFAGISV